jgi:hypothetical protein
LGDFKRPVRRSAARRERLAHLEPARKIDATRWRSCDGQLSIPRESYLRFVVQQSTGKFVGLFRSDDLLDAATDLPASVRAQVRLTYNWFNENLSVPRRMPRNAVCWFRSDAVESIDRLRVLIEAYRMAGHAILMQATQAPGRVVYQDEMQVAAVPYRDHRKTSSAL